MVTSGQQCPLQGLFEQKESQAPKRVLSRGSSVAGDGGRAILLVIGFNNSFCFRFGKPQALILGLPDDI
jgi:hypothetical protein